MNKKFLNTQVLEINNQKIKSTKFKYKSDKKNNNNSPHILIKHTIIDSLTNRENTSFKKNNTHFKCIFSNDEVKKQINEKYANDFNQESNNKLNYIPKRKKSNNLNKKSLNIDDNIIINHLSYFPKKEKKAKKELKEESTNTDNTNFPLYFNDNNLYHINSYSSFENNKIYSRKNKKYIKNNNNTFTNLNDFFKKDNETDNLDLFKKINLTQNNSDYNISLNKKYSKGILHEINKNESKYQHLLNNHYMMQSFIQNKSNFFSMKNENSFPLFFSRINNNNKSHFNEKNIINKTNGFPLREFFRYINNKRTYSSNNHLIGKSNIINQKPKKPLKLKIIGKSLENNNIDNYHSYKRINLANLQYEYKKNNSNNKINKTYFITFRKKDSVVEGNNKIQNFKIKNIGKYQNLKSKNQIINYFKNIFKRNDNIINKNDILDTGITNFSPK